MRGAIRRTLRPLVTFVQGDAPLVRNWREVSASLGVVVLLAGAMVPHLVGAQTLVRRGDHLGRWVTKEFRVTGWGSDALFLSNAGCTATVVGRDGSAASAGQNLKLSCSEVCQAVHYSTIGHAGPVRPGGELILPIPFNNYPSGPKGKYVPTEYPLVVKWFERDRDAERLEQRQKAEEKRKAEEQKRAEEERRAEAGRRAQEARADAEARRARQEQAAVAERERQRAAAEAARERERAAAKAARERERAQIRTSLDYVDGLQRQTKENADRAYQSYASQNDSRIAGYSADLERNAAALEADRSAHAQRSAEIEERIAARQQELGATQGQVADARRSAGAAVDDVFEAMDADSAPQAPAGGVEQVSPDGSNVRYAGAYAGEVRSLLARSPTRWQTPSCKTCNDGVPPQIPPGFTCERDKYVYGALAYAWAAEAYTRVGEPSRAASAAASMHEQLGNATALCSDAPGNEGAPRCTTLGVWPCP